MAAGPGNDLVPQDAACAGEVTTGDGLRQPHTAMSWSRPKGRRATRGRSDSGKWRRTNTISVSIPLPTASLPHPIVLARVLLLRLSYPLDLEWMEGGILTHALRLGRGLPLYAEPSVDFVSFLYTPL